MKKSRTLWALLLSLAMVFSYAPTMVFANGDGEGDGDENTLVATFHANGGYFVNEENPEEQLETMDVETDDYGWIYPPENDPIREGYLFKGWSLEPEAGSDIIWDIYGYVISENTDFYAQWTRVYTVTFHGNGGLFYDYDEDTYVEQYEIEVYEDDNEIYAPSTKPVREDAYVYTGWADENEEPIDLDYGYQVTDDLDLYAQWAEAWQITFDANGGYFESETGETLSTYSEYVIKGDGMDGEWRTPIREADGDNKYAFEGWTRSKADDAEIVDFGYETAEKDETFYAKWVTGYEITYDANGKTFSEEGTQYTDIVSKGRNVYGYCFTSSDGECETIGWSLTPNGEAINTEEFIPTGDTVLYAIWAEKVTLTLDPGEGNFPSWETGETDYKSYIKGSKIEDYATETVSIGGNDVRVAGRRSDNPEHNTKVFSGWYLDADCTQPVTTTTTIEENTTIYAGYTEEYSEVTIDFNGGVDSWYSDESSRVIKVPNGMAIDMGTFGLYKEGMEIADWFTDQDLHNKAIINLVEEDGYYREFYIPNGTVTLYPKWRKERGGFSFYFYRDGEFFVDGDYTVSFDTEGEEINFDEYDFNFVLDIYDADEVFVKNLENNDEVSCFEIERNNETNAPTGIVLKGDAISSEMEDIDNQYLKLTAMLVDSETNEELGKEETNIRVIEPYTEYDADRNNGREFLIGEALDSGAITGAQRYSSEHPDGRYIDLTVKKMEVVSGDAFSVEKQENDMSSEYYYYATAKKLGESKIRIVFENETGEEESTEIVVKCVNERFAVTLSTLNGEQTTFLKNRTLPLKAQGTRETSEGTFYDGITYEWSIDEEWLRDNGNIATITARSDSSASDFKMNDGARDFTNPVVVKGVAKDSAGNARATDTFELNPQESYYEVRNANTFNSKLGIGKSLTIKPEVWYYSCAEQDGDTALNGLNVTDDCEFVLYYFGLSAKDSKGNYIASEDCPPGTLYDDDYQGTTFTGSFTVKRDNPAEAAVTIHAYRKDAEWVAIGSFDFDYLEDIYYSAYINSLKDVTYNGTQHKPKITVKTWEGDTLKAGVDYTISYGANKNVGTGTVTVTGIGNYYGTIKESFKIKAKKITPTVTLSKTSFTYNGKVQKPKVTVKDGKTTLPTSQYTVSWSKGLKNVGTYTATVTLKGNYSGKKSVSYNIIPKGTTLSKLTKAKKAFTVTWKKQTAKMATARITGYQIQYSTKKNFKSGNKTVTVKGYNVGSKKITKLKAKTTYYARIRTYTKVGKKTYYSGWSAVKSVKTN